MASVEAGAPDDLAAALARCADEWRSHGWTLVPSLVPATEIDAALDDLWELFPTPAEFHGDAPDRRRDRFFRGIDTRDIVSPPETQSGPEFRPDQFLGQAEFPFPGSGRGT